jgi:glutamine amidotransferase
MMCELFAMSARYPTTVEMSLEEFARHGGLAGPHKDGWGICWYEARDLRLVKETFPAADSACVRFIRHHPFDSSFVLSHIRKATHGQVALRNCQPFQRELGGAWHAFAHNGDLPDIESDARFRAETFARVGETDSELAFCSLLERLRPLWRPGRKSSVQDRLRVVERFAAELRQLGPANFIYCDGDALYAHADRRRQNDGAIRPPGLWRLARHCPAGGELAAKGLHIGARNGEQEIVLFASVPLTKAAWVPLASGRDRRGAGRPRVRLSRRVQTTFSRESRWMSR